VKIKKETSIREQIMNSAIDSFRLEGIKIPKSKAIKTLRKVEITLGK
jgi:hypothetical protein